MATLNFELLLCLNGMPVPVVKETMPVVDPYQMAGDFGHLNLEEDLEVDLVSLKASADVLWLRKALDLPHRWWLLKSSQLPLLQEIKYLIKAKKPSQGSSSRLPKQQSCLELLKVRDRILMVQNSQTLLHLALSGTFEDKTGTLTWFLKELEKDKKTQEKP